MPLSFICSEPLRIEIPVASKRGIKYLNRSKPNEQKFRRFLSPLFSTPMVRTTFLKTALEYSQARPDNLPDAIRMLVAYCSSALLTLASPRRRITVGSRIPGHSHLTVRVRGLRIQVRPHTNDLGIVVSNLNSELLQWFRVGRGEIVVDVGAHIGFYTLFAACNAKRVISVEPVPANQELLQDNVRCNGLRNVETIEEALSNRSGQAVMWATSALDTATSSLEQGWSGGISVPRHQIQISCETLDDLVTRQSIDRIDWLKIDAEGHELAILEGAKSALKITRHLIIELSSSKATACERLLAQEGFHPVAWDSLIDSPTRNGLFERVS